MSSEGYALCHHDGHVAGVCLRRRTRLRHRSLHQHHRRPKRRPALLGQRRDPRQHHPAGRRAPRSRPPPSPQTVTTVDEVTQTADQAAQRARGVGDAVQRTLEIGQAGRKAVEDSIAALDRLKEQVESTAENILTLAEQAQAIGEIIATVNDIAEQTNLLALNAAIEASRAGEHGRGFAVVAGEVKALADQSKKATAQVRQILGEIQKATNTAVLSTEEVTKGVAAAIKVGGQAGETIKTLADTLAEAAQAATQIVASAGQQATGMAQINQAMKNLDQVSSSQNLAATRQAAQAAENLNRLGADLARFIGK